MNKKGFTLVELIATIAILGIIAVISFVSINKIVLDRKIENCNNLIKNIKMAAKEYVNDNRYTDKFQIDDNNKINRIIFTVDELREEKYLTSDIYDPFTEELWSGESIMIYAQLKKDHSVDKVDVLRNNNLEDCLNTIDYEIDFEKPILSVVNKVNDDDYNGTWTNQNVVSILKYRDDESGVDLNSIQIKLDNKYQKIECTDETECSFTIERGNREENIEYVVCDNVGNCVTEQFSLKQDIKEPTIKIVSKKVGNSDYNGGWTRDVVSVTFEYNDVVVNGVSSGIDKDSIMYYKWNESEKLEVKEIVSEACTKNDENRCTDNWTQQDGGFRIVKGADEVCDNAGNCAMTEKYLIKQDRQAPTCDINVNSEASGAFVFRVSDNGIGVDCTGIGREKIYECTTKEQNKIISCDPTDNYTIYGYVKDKLGNSRTCSIESSRCGTDRLDKTPGMDIESDNGDIEWSEEE